MTTTVNDTAWRGSSDWQKYVEQWALLEFEKFKNAPGFGNECMAFFAGIDAFERAIYEAGRALMERPGERVTFLPLGLTLAFNAGASSAAPIPMVLCCPQCTARHIDEGEFATKPHHTHACQTCGFVWRPAVEPTVGVQFLPGFKNETDGEPQREPVGTDNRSGSPSSRGGESRRSEPVRADTKGRPGSDEASRPVTKCARVGCERQAGPYPGQAGFCCWACRDALAWHTATCIDDDPAVRAAKRIEKENADAGFNLSWRRLEAILRDEFAPLYAEVERLRAEHAKSLQLSIDRRQELSSIYAVVSGEISPDKFPQPWSPVFAAVCQLQREAHAFAPRSESRRVDIAICCPHPAYQHVEPRQDETICSGCREERRSDAMHEFTPRPLDAVVIETIADKLASLATHRFHGRTFTEGGLEHASFRTHAIIKEAFVHAVRAVIGG